MTDLEQAIRRIVREELAKQKPANDVAEHLSVANYAKRWSISPTTVRAAIREGRLEHTRIGKVIRISADAKIGGTKEDEATERARLVLMRGGRLR